MSQTLVVATKIKDVSLLQKACDAMRSRNLIVVGPQLESDGKQSVTLPQWHRPCLFSCDEAGEVSFDNYSDYYDNRQIDPRTGQRIAGSGDVHPMVAAGKVRAGEGGRWGDLAYLDMLQNEYSIASVMQQAAAQGYHVTRGDMTQQSGLVELTVHVPG